MARLKLVYDGPRRLHANQLFRARLEATVDAAMSPGGRIVVATRHFSDFGDPQMDDSAAENYLSVQGGEGSSRWQLKSDNDP